MSLTAGSRLGPYEIHSPLGEGGMGVVYRAVDTNLGRAVAIKVLPEAFASDPDRLARFEREAKTLATLNHPHIAQIYGFERLPAAAFAPGASAPGEAERHLRALVMELVEGPTLADRIAEGPLPLEEALPIARQIAEALEAAHEQGIIHRDLKPANIKVRPDGTVKVLDFGLAKAYEPAATLAGASISPTITSPGMTQMGVILGTAAYMSPEQARGRPVDKRSDIWAFGCVLFEMLTGTRAFKGEDVTDTLATLLKSDVDWTLLPETTPASVCALMKGCLEKGSQARIADIAVASFLLKDPSALVAETHAGRAPAADRRGSVWRRVAVSAAFVIGSLVTGVPMWLVRPADAPPVIRMALMLPDSAPLTLNNVARDLEISPDGTRVAYLSTTGGETRLAVRTLDRLEPTALNVGGIPRDLFFSPDGAWVGFNDTNAPGGASLKKVAVNGGPVQTIVRSLQGPPRGASWGSEGTIVFAGASQASGLWSVPDTGGEPTQLTSANRDRGEVDHLWPAFLPDGRSVLFTIETASQQADLSQIAVLDLRTGTYKTVIAGGTDARYVAGGYVVYVADGAMYAVRFDLDRLEVVGQPVAMNIEVATTLTGGAQFAASSNGTIVYATPSSVDSARRLVWVDRSGGETPLNAPVRPYAYARISPDGTRVAVDIRDQESDIWVWHFGRETLSRITVDRALERYPVWSADGRRVIFDSTRDGSRTMYSQPADGTGQPERLLPTASTDRFAYAVTPDGMHLIFGEAGDARDLLSLSLDEARQVRVLLRTTFAEQNAAISPDGRWIAFQSTSSGTPQVYVRPFPDVEAGQWQVSSNGGLYPVFSRDGRELFYVGLDESMIRVPVGTGPSWSAGTPTKLFDGQSSFTIPGLQGRTYDVSPDGRRFLVIKPATPSGRSGFSASVVIVQNWDQELQRLVRTN